MSPKFQHNDKNSFISSPSAHAILLCSLLANHAEKKDKNEVYKDIETAYNNLKSSPLLFKMEFFNSYIGYIRESGEPGIKVYYFMQEFDSPIYPSPPPLVPTGEGNTTPI